MAVVVEQQLVWCIQFRRFRPNNQHANHIQMISEYIDRYGIGIRCPSILILAPMLNTLLRLNCPHNRFHRLPNKQNYQFALYFATFFHRKVNSPHLHVFKTHLLLPHLNSFGWQRFEILQPASSDASLQSGIPLHKAFFGIHSPFMHVASFNEQAVAGRSHIGFPKHWAEKHLH